MKRFVTRSYALCLVFVTLCRVSSLLAGESATEALHLPFWESADVVKPLGGLTFLANP
ncbi:MAG: hypothetical protein U0929_11995 [Planctomycetaceae bacterium]